MSRIPIWTIALTFACAHPALGQSANFVISYVLADGNVRSFSDGTQIVFPSVDVNATTTATVNVTNQGAAAGTVTGIFVAGTGFQLANSTLLPASIPAGQTLRFGIAFAPTRTGTFTGTVRIDADRSYSGTLAGATPPASFSLSYVDPDTNNIIQLPNGSTLQFPNTLAGSTSTITVLAVNTG